jgi:site-specific recombinase XerD
MQTRVERLQAVHGGKHYPDTAQEQRGRDYLTRVEVVSLLRAAKNSRHGTRDSAMILLAYRHGLRASELVGLRLSDLDLHAGTIYCRRAKGGRQSVHPMKADEIDAVKRVLGRRKWPQSDFVFQSDRVETITRSAFWRIVSEAGKNAGLPIKTYAHQLRHACGYYLSNKGCELRLIQDYLGHKNINNTVRYTRLNPARFAGLW